MARSLAEAREQERCRSRRQRMAGVVQATPDVHVERPSTACKRFEIKPSCIGRAQANGA